MEQDFLKEIGPAGLHSRLKRLSDDILYSTRDYYKSLELDIEPNWILVFLLLEKNGTTTITEISQYLAMSHPACVKIINAMKKRGYVLASIDQNDSRKQQLELSDKSLELFPFFQKHWEAGIKTTQDLLEDSPHFLEDLAAFEAKIKEGSYKDRTLGNLKVKP